MIGIIGASGFIGLNLQDVLINEYANIKNNFILVYFNNPIKKEQLNYLSFYEFIKNKNLISKLETIIIIAGNSSRINKDESNFIDFIKKDIDYINILTKFNVNVILLSSAAVYDGISSIVSENDMCFPDSMYGISKLNSELLAHMWTKTINKKLIIYRLFYAYGNYEKSNRIFRKIINSIEKEETISLYGYNDYINPLNAVTVGRILIETALKIDRFPDLEIINLASFEDIKIIDIICELYKKIKFKYVLKDDKNIITFRLNIEKLKHYANVLNLNINDDLEKIVNFYYGLYQL